MAVSAQSPLDLSQSQVCSPEASRELKILMLHGYTQSGPLFHAKTKALENLLKNSLAPLQITLTYPTGPIRLSANEWPAQPPYHSLPKAGDRVGAGADKDGVEPEAYAWYRRDDAAGVYRQIDEGMRCVAAAITDSGGIDGVIGFSQGGTMAGLVAAALEQRREVVPECSGWVSELHAANKGQRLRFAVSYSGFIGRDDALRWCYTPEISTPTLHFIGSLDTVVDEARSQDFAERCKDPHVVIHPGGHFVPITRQWVMPLAGFIKRHSISIAAQETAEK